MTLSALLTWQGDLYLPLLLNKSTELNQEQWPFPFSWATRRSQNIINSDAWSTVEQILSWELGDV